MTSTGPTVSVVIPTLGREALREAVASVLRQDVPTEVILVNDSGAPLPPGLFPAGTHVIDTPGRCGAAHARNLGMRAATGEFVALLDDDDIWLRGHLKEAIRTLQEHPDADLYSCCALVVYGPTRSRIEPIDLLGSRSIAEYFFGHATWRSRCRRILTPTLVFRRHLADLPMDTTLRMSEDTWWLLTAERERGARMVQSANVGVVVHASTERDDERSRERQRDDLAWARKLEDLVPGAGAAHLAASRSRVAVRAADPGEVVRLGRASLRFPGGWRWMPALTAQAVAASGLWMRRALREGMRS